MDEYIKKADVFEYLSARRNWVLKNPLSTLDTMFVVMEMLDFVDHKVESADVAPVRHGRWEMNSDRPDNIICTNCDVGFDVWKHEAKDFNYCPNCGAKMDLEG